MSEELRAFVARDKRGYFLNIINPGDRYHGLEEVVFVVSVKFKPPNSLATLLNKTRAEARKRGIRRVSGLDD